MAVRLAAGVFVSALVRRVAGAGGHGVVLARGDAEAGSILLVLADRGETTAVVERMPSAGGYVWADAGPGDRTAPMVLTDYIARRRRADPDLWAVELDHPEARAIATDMLG